MKYGWEWCERVNNHVKNHSKFPNLSAPSLVFKIKDATKGAVSKIHMISLVGDELLTLSKFIGEEPILRYVPNKLVFFLSHRLFVFLRCCLLERNNGTCLDVTACRQAIVLMITKPLLPYDGVHGSSNLPLS